jgi:lipoprotein-anchoring transpeptidase ErfK/SrfK
MPIRIFIIALFSVLAVTGAAQAAVEIRVDKSAQRMQVFVDGQLKHNFVVSTGLAGGPPLGTFKPQRMERTWHSRLFNMAPMPYSIFFHGHYAIHGTNQIKKLGQRASKGCVRLHPNNAAILFELVRKQGMANTRIIIEPSSRARTAELAAEPADATASVSAAEPKAAEPKAE